MIQATLIDALFMHIVLCLLLNYVLCILRAYSAVG